MTAGRGRWPTTRWSGEGTLRGVCRSRTFRRRAGELCSARDWELTSMTQHTNAFPEGAGLVSTVRIAARRRPTRDLVL